MGDVFIFVLERGVVLAARPRQDPADFLFLALDQPAVVRRWGTQRGLGQLASEGPTADTIFDPEPDGTLIRKTSIYRQIPCTSERWQRWNGHTC